MRQALATFKNLIAQTNTTIGVYQYMETNGVPVDASDLLRWAWVLTISAFDKYIHDIVRIGMIEEFKGIRAKTSKYNVFQIDMAKYSVIMASQVPELEFENEIIRKHSYLAFQHPEKVLDALSYIWSEPQKLNVISQNLSVPMAPNDLKTKLNNIVIRRNQIVHEGDCLGAGYPFQQEQIIRTDVEDVIEFITDLVNAIHRCVI